MRNFTAKILIALTALVAIVAAASPAFADQTWTVTGTDSAGDGAITIGQWTCSSAITADFLPGPGAPGDGLGRIETISFSSCTNPSGITFVISAALPWLINAKAYSSGRTTGTITDVDLHFSGPLCNLNLGGSLDFSYDNPSHTMTWSGDLTAQNVSGCLGLIQNGETEPVSATYVFTDLTITSP
ncbi:hypothetical protein GCM10023191_000170 [Actinoallomurus oryzae]|jgi:hypothetical protein|uniref:Uncharacterized protein n=1 Tax=Actinoallomurus oryzae TaxID=502180 RepID=A0ABP8P6L9_9ACTN